MTINSFAVVSHTHGNLPALEAMMRHDLLPRIHAIGKLARQMETSDAAKPIYRGSDHWRAA
ncbi:MAG: hypothetical protein QM688_03445 [Sphingomonas bacterium]